MRTTSIIIFSAVFLCCSGITLGQQKKPQSSAKTNLKKEDDAVWVAPPPFYKIGDVCEVCKVSEGTSESEGLRAAELNGKLCFINTQNQLIIPPLYDYDPEKHGKYTRFKNGVCTVKKRNLVGLIDYYNNEIAPFIYKDVYYSPESVHPYFHVTSSAGQGILDEFGIQILPCNYQSIQEVSLGWLNIEYFIVKKNDKVGVVDRKNQVIVDLEYDNVTWEGSKGLFIVEKSDKQGFIKPDSNLKLPPTYLDFGQKC